MDPLNIINKYVRTMDYHVTVAINKLCASRSHTNRTTLQHKQRNPGERRQLRTYSAVKLQHCNVDLQPHGKGGEITHMALKHAILKQLL